MNRRTVFVLLTMFALLAAVTVLQNRQPEPALTLTPTPTPTPAPTFIRVFPDMAVLDIQAVQILNPNTGESFEISRAADGTWTAPEIEGVLDISQATAIAQAIVLMPYERALPMTDQTDLKEYGFDPNGVLLIAVLMANGEQHGIAVGDLTPSREEHYVIVDDREEIYLVKRGPIDLLIEVFVSPPVT